MKQKIIAAWIKKGLSYNALKLQRLIEIKGKTFVLLNKKHGTLTFLEVL